MFLPRAIDHGAPLHLLRRSTISTCSLQRQRLSALLSRTYAVDQRPQPRARPYDNHAGASTARTTNDRYLYPESLTIYDSGFMRVYVLGLTRLACFALIGVTTFFSWSDPHIPNYLIPVGAAIGAVPLILSGVYVGRYVHQIGIQLPRSARDSKESLVAFVNRAPNSTRFTFRTLWFKPNFSSYRMELGQWRRLPPSRFRLANLELQPLKPQSLQEDVSIEMRFRRWFARYWIARYFVDRNRLKHRSLPPGLWDMIMSRMPLKGSVEAEAASHQTSKSTRARSSPDKRR